MNAAADVAQFLSLFEGSGLVGAEQLGAYLDQYRESDTWPDSPGRLAALMIRDGLLTHYQAEQLLAGRRRDFVIANKYKVLERLGSGGMASVYLCEHLVMRRPVALKVLPDVAGGESPKLARFRREARAVAQLNHPNIVAAHDIDRHGRLHFIVMEYVDGMNFEEYVGVHGPMDPFRAGHYVEQAARGLHHAHEAGLVHRDIKPSNLLVDRAGVVKLLDLGLARFSADEVDHLTRARDRNTLLGTIDFMAPEQGLDSHAVDIRADIYGLGATFYFLLTGRGLFGDATPAQKLAAQQYSRPVPIRGLRADLPEGMAVIVDRMLEKDPARRFQSPADLLHALRPWTRGPLPPPPLRESPRLSPAALSAIRKRSDLMAQPGPAPEGADADSSTPTLPASPPWPTLAAGFAPPSQASKSTGPPSTAAGNPPPVGRRRGWVIGVGVAAVGLFAVAILLARPPGPRPFPPPQPPPPRISSPSAREKLNSIGMLLVRVPAGEFFMGTIEEDPAGEADERPRHLVRITRPFYLGQTEVTVDQFRNFTDATGYKTEAESSGLGGWIWNAETKSMEQRPEFTWRHPWFGGPPPGDHPAVQLSWNDAVAFCRYFARKERLPYRLPTEAEWEFACRAGTTSRWSTGDDPAGVRAVGWYDASSGYVPQPVGRLKPNAFGLYDMHGGAREWCADWIGPYADEVQVDPTGPATGTDRVMRGGSWDWDVSRARSGAREAVHPAYRAFTHGFRVCLPTDEPAPAR